MQQEWFGFFWMYVWEAYLISGSPKEFDFIKRESCVISDVNSRREQLFTARRGVSLADLHDSCRLPESW
jgi:hypothetical protein